MRIVVLGGTFAPPTLAHLKLMQRARRYVKAELGIFVPAPARYVREWKNEVSPEKDFLADGTRLKMLNAMIGRKRGLLVDTVELDDPENAYTYLTQRHLAARYGAEQLYFVMGSDKLRDLERWYEGEKLLSEFLFLIAAREDDDPAAIIAGSAFLTRYRSSLILMPGSGQYQHISSTAVRTLIKEGRLEEASRYMPPKVMEIIKKEGF
jgi:nicotinate-nucleotide adenylyltransferase